MDIDLTRKIRKAGKVLDIAVLDHLIIGQEGYFSFADSVLYGLEYSCPPATGGQECQEPTKGNPSNIFG
jgi:hypothetical protein